MKGLLESIWNAPAESVLAVLNQFATVLLVGVVVTAVVMWLVVRHITKIGG